ncbi:ABC transporter ATP-binding protein [Geomicrobium sp. JCM 19037]|uniref:dipeptide ABC transporter ATP-binding protein n=1 Tax=Geomicrobium sp. JCM 19037 TaxID=1460634 RepID=UPI000A7A1842|nr:ABC transporter ATP-binding protein [Geomicrobium sp. JCM 19037]
MKESEKKMRRIRGNDIAMIFQEPLTSLNPVFKIGNQLSEMLILHKKMSKSEAKEKAIEMLERVEIPRARDIYNSYPHSLSGGMRQRVMIAMALSCDPKLLIADEPTTALDVTIQSQILQLMREVTDNFGTSILFITHDLGVVAEMVDKVVVMYAGQVVEMADVYSIFAKPKHPYTKGLLDSTPKIHEEKDELESIAGVVPNPLEMPTGCRFAPRCPQVMDICTQKEPHLLDDEEGKYVAGYLWRKVRGLPMPNAEDKILEVQNLKKYFTIKKGLFGKKSEQLKAVDDISFFVNRGETLGIVGESGCGKSTTGNAIMRLLTPTSGEIFFDGEDFSKLSSKALREKRKDMQMIFQDPFSSLNPRMKVFDIIAEPLRTHHSYSTKQLKSEVLDLMEKVGLSEAQAYRFPHEFSGGQRQRIGIARAIALKPKIIVCDEPVSALDVSIQAQILNLLKKLQKDMDLTFVFIAHGLPAVKHFSDRVAVMYLGKIVEMTTKNSCLISRCTHTQSDC